MDSDADLDSYWQGSATSAPPGKENEMNNDALVAALGMDAVAAVHGYRHAVRAEATHRGLCLISQPLSDVVAVSPGVCVIVDPIDIRLAFVHARGSNLTGRTLTWNPEHGWAMSHRTASGPLCFYAGPGAGSLDLVPTPPQVLDWAVGELDGNGMPPARVDLDDDPEAIRRLLGFLDQSSDFSGVEAFTPTPPRASQS